MRDAFKGFYTHKENTIEQKWKNENTLFVFDANVLLNLYGYAKQTQNDFFKLLNKLDEKIWIPYHVALEYQTQRLPVIKREKAIFRKVNDFLRKIEAPFEKDLPELALQTRLPELHKNTETLQKEIKTAINKYEKSVARWDEKQPCVRSHDEIRDQLDDLFESKIGPKPKNQDWLDELYSEGKHRYESKTPPGFEDQNKDKSESPHFTYDGLFYEKKYGDLIVWKQIIDKAQSSHIKNLIFVSDDSKEDWWYILNSRGKKTIGPHADLQSEIYRETEIDVFHMYNTSEFLEKGKEILEISVHESSIQDASSHFQQAINYTIHARELNKSAQKLRDALNKAEDPWDRLFKQNQAFEVFEAARNFDQIYGKNNHWKKIIDFYKQNPDAANNQTNQRILELLRKSINDNKPEDDSSNENEDDDLEWMN
ncbi:PIN-like domain-containing protein [Guyparkeria sp. TX1]|uniref:PIN-like domain-containing protein n=1 Tax=Guyparkeria sp. TX1 TaxID=3115001 RepID=UPI0039778450